MNTRYLLYAGPRRFWMPLAFAGAAAVAQAGLHTETVLYKDREVTLEGYLAFDDAAGKRPGVLVAPDWMGPGAFSKSRAEELAKLGFVALAVDNHGQGVRPANVKEAAELTGKYKSDRKLIRSRMLAALHVLKARENVDTQRTAAIGYCFGGTSVLELARSGADLSGVVTFHGGFDSPTPAEARNIRAKCGALTALTTPRYARTRWRLSRTRCAKGVWTGRWFSTPMPSTASPIPPRARSDGR